ncbi:tetratricopeptide repeat protein [Teredinibacter turnerae]|uniref:tetratricopeptide repeat protein n=1 Tax=Teredinibacter turnerae TaxID=2426 RepID=UPI0003FCD023|nr:MSHA biogenesis protein MshN [Teredinibacter turnerae]
MSLINDMLRDLDAREKSPNAELENHLGGDRIRIRGYRAWPLFFIAIALALTVGFDLLPGAFTSPSDTSTLPSRVVETSSVRTGTSGDTTKTATFDVNEVAAVIASEQPNNVNPVAPQPSDTEHALAEKTLPSSSGLNVKSPEGEHTGSSGFRSSREKWLSLAALAYEQNRLTLPLENNALYFYRQVLAQMPDDEQAQQGIEKIQQRYKQLLAAAAAKADLERLTFLLGRAERAGFDIHPENYAVTVAQTPEKNNGAGQVAITQSLSSQEDAVCADAERMIAAGNGAQAMRVLEAFIAREADAEKARELLFQAYLDSARYADAKAVVDNWATTPVRKQLLDAKWFVAQGEIAQGLGVLEQTSVKRLESMYAAGIISQSLFEQFNALLAALYRSAGNTLAAAERYQALIAMAPSNFAYWLGYALCSDELGHAENALAAYRQVLSDSQLDQSAHTYVTQRVRQLTALAQRDDGIASSH